MTHLYEYRVEFADDRDDEIVETTMGPSGAAEEIRELYPDATVIEYVGRVA